jgi:hypothetical protein
MVKLVMMECDEWNEIKLRSGLGMKEPRLHRRKKKRLKEANCRCNIGPAVAQGPMPG